MMSGDDAAAMAVTCDLTDEAAVQRAVRKVVAEFGVLHGVVANAGVGGRCAMTDDGSAMRVEKALCGNGVMHADRARTIRPRRAAADPCRRNVADRIGSGRRLGGHGGPSDPGDQPRQGSRVIAVRAPNCPGSPTGT